MARIVRVVNVGPGPGVQGGITRVLDCVVKRLPEDVHVGHISTFTRYTGDPEAGKSARGSRAGQALVYGWAIARVLWLRFTTNPIFHVHVSRRGSLLRKGVVCCMLRVLRSRYVIHSHPADTDLFHAWMPAWARRWVLWGFAGAYRVLVLTRFWQEHFMGLLGLPEERVLLMPNPAELPAEMPQRTRDGGMQFLFLGRLGVRKGTFDLIRAFAGLPEKLRAECRLTMAGDGEVEVARALARKLGCADRISFPGWVGAAEVNQLLRESHALALPSYAEGMAMALLEGLSWGLAVVTTGAGGNEDFLEDGRNSLLVTPGNVEEIRTALTRLIESPELAEQLGRAARVTARRYSVEQYVETLSGLYRELAWGVAAQASGEASPATLLKETTQQ